MSSETITVALEEPPNPASKDAVRQGLVAYNRSKTASDYSEVQIVARSASGEIVGGAIGNTAWGELYVDILWVAESVRGQGVGSRLMAAIEEQARVRKSHRVHLGTMTHQAPDFYPKIGYIQCGFFPGANGWPDRYLFYKDIPENMDASIDKDPSA